MLDKINDGRDRTDGLIANIMNQMQQTETDSRKLEQTLRQ